MREWRFIGCASSGAGGYFAEFHLYQDGCPVPLGIEDKRIDVVYAQGRGETPQAAIDAAQAQIAQTSMIDA